MICTVFGGWDEMNTYAFIDNPDNMDLYDSFIRKSWKVGLFSFLFYKSFLTNPVSNLRTTGPIIKRRSQGPSWICLGQSTEVELYEYRLSVNKKFFARGLTLWLLNVEPKLLLNVLLPYSNNGCFPSFFQTPLTPINICSWSYEQCSKYILPYSSKRDGQSTRADW